MNIKNKQMKKEYLKQIKQKNMFHRCDKCGCINTILGKWEIFGYVIIVLEEWFI